MAVPRDESSSTTAHARPDPWDEQDDANDDDTKQQSPRTNHTSLPDSLDYDETKARTRPVQTPSRRTTKNNYRRENDDGLTFVAEEFPSQDLYEMLRERVKLAKSDVDILSKHTKFLPSVASNDAGLRVMCLTSAVYFLFFLSGKYYPNDEHEEAPTMTAVVQSHVHQMTDVLSKTLTTDLLLGTNEKVCVSF